MIHPSKLPNRVTILRHVEGVDEIGQPIDTWQELLENIWANIRHLNGTETLKAGAETSIVKASIRIRYRAGIDAGMRVLHKAVAYEIKAVLPDEVNREHVDLVCEVVA